MYSYEIEQILKSHNYYINSDIYLHICNTSPQISRVTFEPYEYNFNIWTNDNYHWTFKVKSRGES